MVERENPAVTASDDGVDEAAISRREALKKAAIGAGVVGAVWSAPRIEGLSIVPDYAAAGTFAGTIVFNKNQRDCNPGASANCWGNCTGTNTCAPLTYSGANAVPVYSPFMGTPAGGPGSGGTFDSATNVTNFASPPANRNEFIAVTWSGPADTNSTGMASLNFSANMDPPFNHCTITMLSGTVGDIIMTGWPAGNLSFMNMNAAPAPANFADSADATFMTPIISQGNDLTITITCNAT